MTKLPGLRGKFQLVRNLPKGLIIKVAMVLVLSIIAVLLFYTNKDLMEKNQKMIKYIKNEEVFKRELMHLKKSENQFGKYIIKVGKNAANADLEKIKSGYINELLDMIKKDNLQVDSYRSEIQESDGFAIFKYNITIVGEFIQVLRFLNRMLEQSRHIYVSRYDIRLHISTKVRMGLTVDIIGMK